jgi:hypothetical protein
MKLSRGHAIRSTLLVLLCGLWAGCGSGNSSDLFSDTPDAEFDASGGAAGDAGIDAHAGGAAGDASADVATKGGAGGNAGAAGVGGAVAGAGGAGGAAGAAGGASGSAGAAGQCGSCDDGLPCTLDFCKAGVCAHTPGPNSGATACTKGYVCDQTKGCVLGVACADTPQCLQLFQSDACKTNIYCEPTTSTCVYGALDKDGDGHPPAVCGGDDCNDADATIAPGKTDVCDGKDNNCDGKTDEQAKCTGLLMCQAGTCVCPVAFTCGALCVDTTSDPAHCGACSTTCPAAATCENGVCACPGSTSVCAGQCVDLTSDPKNCGTCGTVCGAGYSCLSGGCACSKTACAGICTDTSSDPGNCGGCGIACANPHGSTSCVASACLSVCTTGFDDCDGNPSNGCETSLTSLSSCGACGVGCSLPNASSQCTNGICSLSGCYSGWGNCDGSTPDGCEANTSSSVANCGSCGFSCSSVHGTAGCQSGACTIACSAGWANCDGNASNGCEVDTTTNANFCGGCSVGCTNAHGGTSCVASTCVPQCAGGYSDCDANPNNGCETGVQTSPSNCGSCGHVCSCSSGTPSCTAGVCGCGCAPGWADCDGNTANGCEAQLNTLLNCGTCGQACSRVNAIATCASGTCQISSCNSGFGNCDANDANGCELSLNTTSNCGSCGYACGTCSTGYYPKCSSGSCVCNSCGASWGDCDGNTTNGCEASLSTVTNCGSCGIACSNANGTTKCSSGTCSPTCNAGWASCDGNGTNGCEASIVTSTSNCGSCGKACTNAHGSTSCINGVCVPVCAAGWSNCDSNATNGCETNTASSTTNCGACGNVCNSLHGTPACSSGVCSITCSEGWDDCDKNAGTGCETNLTTGMNDCGACGAVCANPHGTAACQAQSCILTCAAGYGDCDSSVANGCEAAISGSCSCTADTTPDSCPGTDLGQIAIDGSLTVQGNVTPAGDADAYVVSFAVAATCSLGPRITLDNHGRPIYLQVTTSCGGVGMTCLEGGASDKANVSEWAFTWQGSGCGATGTANPGNATFLPELPSPAVFYVRVYATGTDPASCLSYSLRLRN